MENKKVIIIGGGASGIMAAISCKKNNPKHEVVILEKNFKLGRKILATGNGRCNIMNTNLNIERYHTSSKSKNLIKNIIKNFDEKSMSDFFNNQNLSLITEKEGRIFPRTNQSIAVVEALKYELKNLQIQIEYNTEVKKIDKKNNKFLISAIKHNEEISSQVLLNADYVIIATGGLSYSNLGSTGDGFIFAKKFNHNIIKDFPSITALKLKSKTLKNISGVRQEAVVKVLINNKLIKEYFEEILFTDYGISGSAILQISRFAIENLLKGKKVEISLQFTPKEIIKDQVKKRITDQVKLNPNKSVRSILLYFLNTILIDNFFSKIENKSCKDLSKNEINQLVEVITDTRFEVSGYRGYEQAQVTAGGVDLDEINSKTLESKLVENLYFCGEVLDVDGDCGGFNLSWAWSSGYVAGQLKKA